MMQIGVVNVLVVVVMKGIGSGGGFCGSGSGNENPRYNKCVQRIDNIKLAL